MAKVLGAASAIHFLTICFFIIYNFDVCAARNDDKIHHVALDPELEILSPSFAIARSRARRQEPQDAKSQNDGGTASNAASGGNNKQVIPPITTQQQNAQTNSDASVVIPYNDSDRLLGVNGTGQRKDYTGSKQQQQQQPAKPTVVSEPIQPTAATDATVAKKPNAFPKKVGPTTFAATLSATQMADTLNVDNIDVPDNETLKTIQEHNYTVNLITDHHNYYNSTIYTDQAETARIWNNIKNIPLNQMLSHSHQKAVTMELSFDFPYYGHPVRNITVATGGFVYTGEYVHSWLAATQYIAPLMGNFDTSLNNDSFVRLKDNGTAFTVIWENVTLQEKPDRGKFTFSTTLHKNGDIVFVYYHVPVIVNTIEDNKHPVKVGLSDAYIIDKVVYYARRKTIYEYHRVNFANAEITNSTVIYLTALPTCLAYSDCASCINHQTNFDCVWCPSLNRCSTGTDRKKQEWLSKGCDRSQITDGHNCPAIGQKGNNSNQTNSSTDVTQSPSNTNNNSNNNHDNYPNDKHTNEADAPSHAGGDMIESATVTSLNINPVNKKMRATMDDPNQPKSMGLALGFLVPICLVVSIMLWVLYAYRNPHTKSGQLLIQYRPSQWSWRRGEARYTAATIHM